MSLAFFICYVTIYLDNIFFFIEQTTQIFLSMTKDNSSQTFQHVPCCFGFVSR